MNDYIKREDAIDIADTLIMIEDGYRNRNYGVRLYEQKLKELPSADVVEHKRGHWILSQDERYEYCTCSECGYENGENWMIGSEIPFCANCGADMRERKDNE